MIGKCDEDFGVPGVWDWNIVTGEVYHNNQWYAILGHKEGEIDDSIQAFSQMIHPKDAQQVWDRI